VEVLAEDAAQIAPGEKDGAAAVPAAQAILFAEVGKVAADEGGEPAAVTTLFFQRKKT